MDLVRCPAQTNLRPIQQRQPANQCGDPLVVRLPAQEGEHVPGHAKQCDSPGKTSVPSSDRRALSHRLHGASLKNSNQVVLQVTRIPNYVTAGVRSLRPINPTSPTFRQTAFDLDWFKMLPQIADGR